MQRGDAPQRRGLQEPLTMSGGLMIGWSRLEFNRPHEVKPKVIDVIEMNHHPAPVNHTHGMPLGAPDSL
jgi:hypothetical protein